MFVGFEELNTLRYIRKSIVGIGNLSGSQEVQEQVNKFAVVTIISAKVFLKFVNVGLSGSDGVSEFLESDQNLTK